MKVTEYKKPYHHVVVDDFLPKNIFNEINNKLYDIDCEIPSVTDFERFSELPACVPLTPKVGDNDFIDWELHDKYAGTSINYIDEFFDFSNPLKNYDKSEKIKTITDKFHWTGYYEIGRDSFRPHTDNAWRNLEDDLYYAGIIKGVLYFGKEDIDYTNYGTVLLNPDTFTFAKEVEFKPNRLILFDTRDDSLHATDYHKEMRATQAPINETEFSKTTTQLEHKRFSYNVEYRAIDTLSLEEVANLYNKIEYPNARLLEWWMKGQIKTVI